MFLFVKSHSQLQQSWFPSAQADSSLVTVCKPVPPGSTPSSPTFETVKSLPQVFTCGRSCSTMRGFSFMFTEKWQELPAFLIWVCCWGYWSSDCFKLSLVDHRWAKEVSAWSQVFAINFSPMVDKEVQPVVQYDDQPHHAAHGMNGISHMWSTHGINCIL